MAQGRDWRDALVKACIYIEGGGDSKELHIQSRMGFRKLMEQCGFSGRMPRLVACGGRSATYGDFTTAHQSNKADYVAMLIDSEDPVSDLEKPWDHLARCDSWAKPNGAHDEQVLLMVTCMETWITTDRATLRSHYRVNLQESALPALNDMELRARHTVQDQLVHATRNCQNAYAKGKRSFEIVGKLSPDALKSHLPSFQRFLRILGAKL